MDIREIFTKKTDVFDVSSSDLQLYADFLGDRIGQLGSLEQGEISDLKAAFDVKAAEIKGKYVSQVQRLRDQLLKVRGVLDGTNDKS